MFLVISGMEETNVIMTSNLNEGNTAYDAQTVTFLCVTQGIGTLLSWTSGDYIGSGGAALEFFSIHGPGTTEHSSTNPTTVATLISATNNATTRVSTIISELRITVSEQYPTSSVNCSVSNGNEESNTTEFRKADACIVCTSLCSWGKKRGQKLIKISDK